MKRVTSFRIFYLNLLVVIMASCQTNPAIYEEYRKFEDLSWNRFDILQFIAPVDNVQSPVDIFLNIRHLPEVPYEEMTIQFTLFSPSGDMRTSEHTFDFIDRDGKRISDCMGDYCDLLVPIRKAFRFNETGTVKFEIENKFTKVEMPGILEVGLIIKTAKGEE